MLEEEKLKKLESWIEAIPIDELCWLDLSESECRCMMQAFDILRRNIEQYGDGYHIKLSLCIEKIAKQLLKSVTGPQCIKSEAQNG